MRRLSKALRGRSSIVALAIAVALGTSAAVYGQVKETIELNEFRPHAADRADMVGEWSGLTAAQDVLVTLKVGRGGEKNVLIVAQIVGDAVLAKVHDAGDLRVHEGEFSIGGADQDVALEGKASVTSLGNGSGRGKLVFHDDSRQRREADVYLFLVRNQSWISRLRERARRYGLL